MVLAHQGKLIHLLFTEDDHVDIVIPLFTEESQIN